jgi:glycosyltransferase involved in cell wall biosynthesis
VQNEVAGWYSAFDAFLLPSLLEGLPVVAVEAQTAGLPCFIADTITDEVKIIDKVHYCALTDGADNWAKEILSESYAITDRSGYADMIKESEYNIVNSALKLKQIYIELNGEI